MGGWVDLRSMKKDSKSLLMKIRELIEINRSIRDSINPEREVLLNRKEEISISLKKYILKENQPAKEKSELMDEYFKISKELNDKKYLVIDEEIDRRYNEIFRLKNELQSIDDYNKGYKDGIEKVEIDAIKEELNAIKKERQLTQENKITTNDALWAIADDMREKKDKGKFGTYREAYEWAQNNIIKKNVVITVHKLERAYHKAKSEGKV